MVGFLLLFDLVVLVFALRDAPGNLFVEPVGVDDCVDDLVAVEDLLGRQLAGEHQEQFFFDAIERESVFDIDPEDLLDFSFDEWELGVDDYLEYALLQLLKCHFEVDHLGVGEQLHRVAAASISTPFSGVGVAGSVQVESVGRVDGYVFLPALDCFLLPLCAYHWINNEPQRVVENCCIHFDENNSTIEDGRLY